MSHFTTCFLGNVLTYLGQSPVCHVSISNEGRSSSILIGLSKDCKWMPHEAALTPWCHAVVHFELKQAIFQPMMGTMA